VLLYIGLCLKFRIDQHHRASIRSSIFLLALHCRVLEEAVRLTKEGLFM
jgi:hypothetical protein